MSKKEVATTLDQAAMVEAAEGNYYEGIDSTDLAIPFIKVLQDGSPQVKNKGLDRIEGVESGDILDTVRGKLWKGSEGLWVIPCHYKKQFIEWVPRDHGGGFVTAHDRMPEDVEKEGFKWIRVNGNEIHETATHAVCVVEETGMYRAVIPMTSTKLKNSREWNTKMQMNTVVVKGREEPYIERITPMPPFAFSYHLTTLERPKDQYLFYVWRIGPAVAIEDMDIFMEAKAFADAMRASEVTIDHNQNKDDVVASGTNAADHV